MTKEEKDLLLKDLCARLPYGVMCSIKDDDTNTPRKLSRIEVDELDSILLDFWTDREDYLSIQVYLSEVKPYLRPMSSMTEEEKIEWDAEYAYNSHTYSYEEYLARMLDWLNKKKFDYRGLIPMGLALEAKEGMYNFN